MEEAMTPRKPELIGSAEIARRLGVVSSTPRVWKARYDDYPEEVVPGYWIWSDVASWYKHSGLAKTA